MSLRSELRDRRRPILCYVTERGSLPAIPETSSTSALERKIRENISAGVDWIQIREKDLSARDLVELTRRAVHFARESPEACRIVVNDRADAAIVTRADGVHLGENSIGIQEARRLVADKSPGENFQIGVSCHSLQGVQGAVEGGADYVFFGPIFSTPSKAAFGEPQGLTHLQEVCRTVSVPVLAIGGITLENARSCLAAGAAGIAAIRLFQDASNVLDVVAALRRAGSYG